MPLTPESSTPLVRIRDLQVDFLNEKGEASSAVKSVSLDIARGKTHALVGESGSGKSVTALSILRLLPENTRIRGHIQFEGEDLAGLSVRQMQGIRGRHIGMIFQEPLTSLNPLHSVGKQIAEVIQQHSGSSRKDALTQALQLLDRVHIPDATNRIKNYPHELSGGQRQRVMIAMALANNPALLIADEPTTALDVTVQRQILELIRELQKDLGMSVLFISHDLPVVRYISDTVSVMKDGRVLESGETEALFDQPRHAYTLTLKNAEAAGRPAPVSPVAPTLLEARDLKVWFPVKSGFMRKVTGHIKALNPTDFIVRQGETLGIVGESGSGKTTLAQALLRLIASEGDIMFGSHPIQGLNQAGFRPFRKDMQIVFQDPFGSLSPRMAVGDIIAEGLEVHEPDLGKKERSERVSSVLTEVGLNPADSNRYPHEFSGGQRQRIAIARALILKPRLIILDEPTSALDRTVQKQIIELLRALQASHQLTYIFISHDLHVVRALAHRVLVLRSGELVESGDTDRVLTAPESAYCRMLIESAL
jgi:microcin C transport system ATP-binding protein